MQHRDLHLWLIPVLPLVGAAINGLFGRRFPKKAVAAVALLFPALAFAFALWIVSQAGSIPLPYDINYGTWITAGSFTANFGFYLDQLTIVMLMVVTGVGFLIHIYATGYMADDDGYYRFFSYLNLFMFFMSTLILADNYLLMFVGWEGVGLASYLLIGFYFLKDSAAQAGKKAFITNRIGDFAFLIGMFLIIKTFGSLDYAKVFPAALNHPVESAGAGVLTAIALCLLGGATGKSAQVPLYVWLPDAMEGPTPVSALIHAATMVTAGVYMIARSNIIFDHAPKALLAVAIIGAVTAIFAASIGIVQNDIKRVLAYSTISQLGYMFMACGVAAYSAGIFHLMTHAFFKALLFLSAGAVIHGMSGEQDMRHMGGLRKYMPVTFAVMTVATIAIAGIPPFAGFFSKDEILWKAYSSGPSGWIFWLIGLITAFMTSFYMFRLWFMTFFGELRGPAHNAHQEPHGHTTPASKADTLHASHQANEIHAHAHGGASSTGDTHSHAATHGGGHGSHAPHESPWVMLGPLVVLAVLSIVGGWVGVPHSMGGGNNFEKYLAPVFEHERPEASAVNTGMSTPEGTVSRSSGSASPQQSANEPAPKPGEQSKYATRGPAAEPQPSGNTELILTGVSVAAALSGFFLAWLLYFKKPELPARITAHIGGLYRTVLNKYYVDEGYYALFVNPIVNESREFLWRTIDVGLIDGTVNGAGHTAREASGTIRRMQSGSIRSYAAWVAAGAVCILGYLFVTRRLF